MKIKNTSIFLFLFLFSDHVVSQPAEKIDHPNEFLISRVCNYRIEQAQYLDKKLIDAKNGDSLAAYYLFFGRSFFKNNNLPSEEQLMKIVLANGNPIGAFIYGLKQLDIGNLEEGVAWIKVAADFGILEANHYMKVIYTGKEFPILKNKEQELAWSLKIALSGNTYDLKRYIYNNPHKLPSSKLKNWQDAYNIIIRSKDFEFIYKNKSLKTSWLLFQINENRERITKVLKNHHPWYGDYTYCK